MRLAVVMLAVGLLRAQQPLAQQPPAPPPLPQDKPSDAEQFDMMHAVNEGANSTVDLVRVFEEFLKKYPNTGYLPDIEANLTKASIQNNDDARIVKYGERVLVRTPDDVPTLDRVSISLLALGGKENAEKALNYARALDGLIGGLQPPDGRPDGPQIQDQRDRAQARALMTEARAQAMLGDNEESLRMADRAYALYPGEETARVSAEALLRLGREKEGLQRLAEAFIIPDSHAKDSDIMSDRLRLGEMWRKSYESEKGLGDEILVAYDRASSAVELRRKKLLALDPNGAAKNVGEFTITGLDGHKLQMSSLAGKVLVLDFWATWCEPCRGQHPIYEDVMKRYKDRGDVVFLPLSVDEDHAVVSPFLESMKWSDDIYFDDGLQRVLGVSQIPTTIVLGKKGEVSSRMNGFAPDRFKDDLIDRIDAALAESDAKKP